MEEGAGPGGERPRRGRGPGGGGAQEGERPRRGRGAGGGGAQDQANMVTCYALRYLVQSK